MNDQQTQTPRKAYRAYVNFDHSGASVWCLHGDVSHCGEWIEAGDTRWRRTAEWFDTIAEARASKAAKVAEMGSKLLRQAAELTAAGEVAA
jgi:hypothetical protein